MAQRVAMAMAWICQPSLVIADEPTSGLDVTVQAQVLDLLRGLVQEQGVAVLIITHELGVVAQYCHRVVVMRNGEVVESAPTLDLFESPQHAYTRCY